MTTHSIGRCWHCGYSLTEFDVGREAYCGQCNKAVHVCKNCRYYQPGRANDCLEPIAEFVSDKVRANFCDYFQPHEGAYKGATDAASDALAAAESLFRT